MFPFCNLLYDTRRQRRRAVPPSTVSSVQLALAYLLERTPGGTLVQIGACDGAAGDPVSHFVRRGVMQAILVEPVTSNFEKLQQTYAGVPGVSLVQAAIAHHDGEVTMYRARAAGRWADDPWVSQVSSFDRKHLLRHGVRSHEIEEVTVPAISLPSLLTRFGIDKLDVLQIDVEGFDAEIVKMALSLPTPPDVINFERMHLTAAGIKAVFENLKRCGYTWTHDFFDTLALHHRFTQQWQSSLATNS